MLKLFSTDDRYTRSRFIYLFLICLNLNILYASYPLDKFHVCTVASHETETLKSLITSCKHNNISLDILGLRQPYYGNGSKLLYVEGYLEQFDDDEIVMFVDGYDVLIVSDKKVILQEFLSMNIPFLISVERCCWPINPASHQLPQSLTPFRFINTGSYIGYVGHLKKWLLSFEFISKEKDDQFQVFHHYLESSENKKFYFFDYDCRIFLPLYGVPDDWIRLDCAQRSIYLAPTHSTPHVVHANGHSFKLYRKIYELFFVK